MTKDTALGVLDRSVHVIEFWALATAKATNHSAHSGVAMSFSKAEQTSVEISEQLPDRFGCDSVLSGN